MTPHPYYGPRTQFCLPPDEPWKCSDCGNTCEAWRCDICLELHCGYDESGPIEVQTLSDGLKRACRDCAEVNLDDCRARDLRDALIILAGLLDRAYSDSGSTISNAIEYLERELCAEQNVGVAEFHSALLAEACELCGTLNAKIDPWNCPKCAAAEAHSHAAVYVERFGEVPNA